MDYLVCNKEKSYTEEYKSISSLVFCQKKYLDFTTFQVIGIYCIYHSNKGFSKFDTSYHCKSDLIRKTLNSVKFTQAKVLYLIQLRSKTKSNEQVKSLLGSQAKYFLKYYLSIKNNYSI